MSENEKDQIPSDDYERELETDLDDETADKPKGMAQHTKILLGLLVGAVGGLLVNWSLGGAHPNVVWVVSNITQPIGTVFLRRLSSSRTVRGGPLRRIVSSLPCPERTWGHARCD